MESLKKAFNQSSNTNEQAAGGGGNGGMMDKINSSLGGGPSSEKNEDFLDKGVDFVQQRMGGGQQSNESAIEQAKDEQISDAIRAQYKSATGKDFPIADK
ncbi:hypothetical protein H2248_001745 [Termitomyces sp. 'cryptogamus']|nr:hypothetical protein H2248_001745 [Termitomyces sp. 'cryptogamus']